MKNSSPFFEKQPIPKDPKDFAAYANKLLDHINDLETKLALLNRSKFGQSSERYTGQAILFDEAEYSLEKEEIADDEIGSSEDPDPRPKPPKKKRKKNIDLSAIENREIHHHDLSEEEKKCSCCGEEMECINQRKTEKLEVIPPQAKVHENIYYTYACKTKNCLDGEIKDAKAEQSELSRLKATASTLAFIAVQKYFYGLPLYRIAHMISLMGAPISRYVLSLWMIKMANALKPIYLSLEDKALSSHYLHMDETGLQVLREVGRKATTKSFAWVRRTGDPNAPPVVLFHYSPTRSAAVAKSLLQGFRGHLQTDDYEGYACALKNNNDVTRLLCWDHARRYFEKAYKLIPEKSRKGTVSDQALKLIKKLYKIEKGIKGKLPEDRLKARQTQSKETLNKIEKLCEENIASFSKDSLTLKAIKYTLSNWKDLNVYLTNPLLNIANSPAEQAIRPFVVGRKAWLFSNTPRGAEASMILYSLMITAKENGLNPFRYLRDTLNKLSSVNCADDLEELLPLRKISSDLNEG